MPSRWGPDGPPPEAYSRVTDPQRYAGVVGAADRLVAELAATYEVDVATVVVADSVRAVRLAPDVGAPVVFAVTSFPGVRLHLGAWSRTAFPRCGCDACDDDPADVIRELHEVVGDVVGGAFSERLTRDPCRLWTSLSTSQGWSSLRDDDFVELSALAPPGEHVWPPWPRRGAATATATP